MNTVFNLLPSVLMISAPIIIAAAGGMICERSGIVNIALEGLMGIGAFSAAALHFILESTAVHNASIPLALAAASISGLVLSVIHAYSSITLGAEQTISGTGINLLVSGLTMFASQILFSSDRTPPFKMGMLPVFSGVYPTAFIALAVVLICAFIMNFLPAGLRLRACGEHPQAAAAAGVNVKKIRYIAVLASGFLSGLSGACMVLTETIQYTPTTINGTGYIALAAVSFGRWRSSGVTASSLLFGAAAAFAIISQNINILRQNLPAEVFSALPYLITLLALVAFSGKNYAPRALGQTEQG